MLRAFLFDFDGTLFDTEPLHHAAFVEVLGPRGIVLGRERYFTRYLSLTDRECLERAIEDFGRPDLRGEVDRLVLEKSRAMARLLARGVAPLPGAAAFVAEAARIGPCAIVSGALRREIETILAAAGLADRFRVIVSAEDVARGKPDPEGYRLGWRRLRGLLPGLEPAECLAVEDSPKGVDAARAAGLRVLAVTQSRPAGDLRAADRIIEGYDAVGWDDLRGLFA
jgi:HAD superfamily hydrolase (TIGR01509 family)